MRGAAAFFVRYWRDTRERLFILFGAAFFLMAIERVLQVVLHERRENIPALYFIRLLAFLLILCAMVDKNLARS